jgi:hypothetical protein
MSERGGDDGLVALLERRGDSARFYAGALRVLNDGGNPVRIEMAAYGLREMLDELEIAAGLTPSGSSLGARVRELKDAWAAAKHEGDGSLSSGQVKLTRKMGSFFTDFDRDYPSRRIRAGMTVRGIAPFERSWPPVVEREAADRLMALRKRLNKGLHRGDGLTRSQLLAVLDELETFLRGVMAPPTFDRFDEIDAIVARGNLGE